MKTPTSFLCLGVLLFWFMNGAAVSAQEPINAADSATQPSPGHVIFKEQVRYLRMDLNEGPRDRRGEFNDVVFHSTLNIGLGSHTSLSLRMPVVLRSRDFDGTDETERDQGIGDFTAVAKWRVYQNDSTALNSERLSLLGGVQIRTGDSPFTSDAYNPIVGLAFTKVADRHGMNASLEWMFATDGNGEPILAGESTADVLRYDLAYLYRLSPEKYAADTHGAMFAVIELNGLYETNGDNEILIAPGLMYEAKAWTTELSVQLPAWQRIDHRAETEYAIVAGLRFSW